MPDFEEKKDNLGLPFEANHRGGVVSEPTLTKEHGNEERNIVSCSLIISFVLLPHHCCGDGSAGLHKLSYF